MGEVKVVKPTAGLIVSLTGGLTAVLFGLAFEGLISMLGFGPTRYGTLSFVFGLLMMVGAVIGYRGKIKLGGLMVIIFSLLNLGGLGILAFLPILFGFIGGVLILIGK